LDKKMTVDPPKPRAKGTFTFFLSPLKHNNNNNSLLSQASWGRHKHEINILLPPMFTGK